MNLSGISWRTSGRIVVALAAMVALRAAPALGQARSEPAILQMYEARWDTIEDRMADIFESGYGQMWLPPPQKAGGGQSVGYDVFDRFDLGSPRSETLYGTETSLKAQLAAAHSAGLSVYTDFIPNHNGFGNRFNSSFVNQGGYPGFALTLPGDVNGDFHDPSAGGVHEGQISGLNDIAQEKNHQFIRHPIAPGPNNIPAGTLFNQPNPNNARFYTDQSLGGMVLNDPATGGNFTRYNFNAEAPLAGDPVLENSMGLLMRNAQWMIEVVGVDGFRVDAAKHFPSWVMNYLDQAVYRANPRLQHDGSIQPAFMFSEVYDGNKSLQQEYIRKTLPNPHAIAPSDTTVVGNRDVVDFPLFFALRDNLTNNGTANNWHNIRGASMDANDRPAGTEVWHSDGSQGVAFVQSHDDFGPHLSNVAHAYTLLRPGNAIVYTNAKEFGNGRDFPKDGRGDALGGLYGDAITTLVDLRNTHGRGDFRERWIDNAFTPNGFSNIYVYEREKSAIVGLNSRLDAGYDQRTPVQTAFAPGTVLVELTGNAADSTVDPTSSIPEAIRVNASGQVTLRIPRNSTHGNGYVVYGVAGPQGALSLTGVASTLSGATPTAANNGTARLADIDVITGESFTVQLNTTPVTLPAPMGEVNPVRDVHADGDLAMIRLNDGVELNGNGGIDDTSPASLNYGFEHFTTQSSPGYVWSGGTNVGTGSGTFAQQIDATQLAEGRHYVTVRAFRHRDSATGGDGGPAVFTDFKRTIYVDRLAPESDVVSFAPYVSDPNNPNNRDLIVRSLDQTADSVHVLWNLPVTLTDAQVLAQVSGSNKMNYYDRDQFIRGQSVNFGNHVATVVTYEVTGNVNVQRFPGLFAPTNGRGRGFGDMNFSNGYVLADIRATTPNNGSVEDVLYSQNSKYSSAFDVNGDGLGDNRDLFLLGAELIANGASQTVLNGYTDLLLKRGDLNSSSVTDIVDFGALFANYGPATWTFDLNVDGVVNALDAETFVTELVRSVPGDFNVDGQVDAADYTVWQDRVGQGGAALVADGNFDGVVDGQDYNVWRSAYGFARQALTPGSGGASVAAVPEPTVWWLCMVAGGIFRMCRPVRRSRT